MSTKRVLLDKKLKDRRFRKNEDSILNIFIHERRGELTVKKIAKKAGLARSTIYIHHHAIREIIPDYERYLLTEYTKLIRKKLARKNVQLRVLYLDTLLFILRNKRIFEMFLKLNNREIITKMVGKLKSVITQSARLPRNSDKTFRIYTSEITEIICDWGVQGFPDGEIERVLSDIMYLTGTCRDRLLPLER